MRVYLPMTMTGLRELAAAGAIPDGLEGFAATAAVHVDLAGCTDEEVEFALAEAAGDESADRQRAAGTTPGRRVVVVLELDDREVSTGDGESGQVVVGTGVGIERIEAILVDPPEVGLAGADEPLAWYAAQELPYLLA